MNGLILTGGSLDLAFAASLLENYQFDKMIAVDGGLKAVKELGLIPNAIVGDFDTAPPEIVDEFKRMAGPVTWDIHKPEKDETDTELALAVAARLGCTQVLVLGATGGRLDHLLANVHLLYYCHELGMEGRIADPQNNLYLLMGKKVFTRQAVWGRYISFIPFTEQVTGITLKGFKYPLHKKDIKIGRESGLCVSNELTEETGSIEFDSGILICVESKD
ncbi:MAG: thiamine diphosphokinase [Clostridiaceae bacterium]|nr:thiamine diphosphokinase [Clostridiaceae bacterium]